MKKALSILLAVLLLTACLTGCGSTASDLSSSESESFNGSSFDRGDHNGSSGGDSVYTSEDTADTDFDSESSALLSGIQVDMSEKIIYTAYADVETIDFDGSVEKIYELMEQYNAFLESSYIEGKSYSVEFYGRQSYRTAQLTIRVPRENFSALTSGLGVLGNVLSVNLYTDNITTSYIDTESRLETYQVEEERLLAMLEKAETVDDMISIEERLSNVRYNIESLTSQLKNWDNQVNYCTVTVNINEVKELTEQLPISRSYWQELGDGLKSTLKDIGNFFKNTFKFIIVNAPTIIILAAVAIVVILLVKKAAKHKRRKVTSNLPVESNSDNDKESE